MVSSFVMGDSFGNGVDQAQADDALEQVRATAQGILDNHYGDGFATDIRVRREESMADDEHDTYLDITVAFAAEDPKDCDPAWLTTFLTELRAALLKAGIEEFPVLSYLLKPEWDPRRVRNWIRSSW